MKMGKEILGRILAFWATLIFLSGLLIVVIPIWAIGFYSEPRRTKASFLLMSAWMKYFFVMSGVKRRIVGQKNFILRENYVVVCNHRSLLDPPLSSLCIPGPNKTIAKQEMARIPLFNIIYKRGSVLVDRKSDESRRQSYIKMKEVLFMGMHMCIYPEGTRNKSDQPLQRFHDGAFKLAVETEKAIIPSLIFNTDKVLPRKPYFFWPQKVGIHFLPAIPSKGKTIPQLKEEVFDVMKNYYLQHQ